MRDMTISGHNAVKSQFRLFHCPVRDAYVQISRMTDFNELSTNHDVRIIHVRETWKHGVCIKRNSRSCAIRDWFALYSQSYIMLP